MCRDKGDWDRLNASLNIINKRRAQSKVAIAAIVEEAFSYIDVTPTLDIRIELIKTLKDICDGKIYVEAESARLHLKLAHIYEEGGDVAKACDMIQDVHVETYGALSKKEKAEYILEQIRLNLLKKDFVRALIQSRKMNRKVIEEAGFEQVKVSFYTMLIEYYTNEKDTWEICQCYYKIYDTSITKADPSALQQALESCVIFLILSKHDNHQSDMLHRTKILKDAIESPFLHHLLVLFTTKEIIPSSFTGLAEILSHSSLSIHGLEASQFFSGQLQIRIIQHNLRTIAGYYDRLRIERLSTLIALPKESIEEQLAEMSLAGDLYVKIDRPAGIVSFKKPRAPEAVLSDWSSDVGKLLNLMAKFLFQA